MRLHWRFFKVSPHDTIAPSGLFIVKRARRETSDGAPVLVAFMETLSDALPFVTAGILSHARKMYARKEKQ